MTRTPPELPAVRRRDGNGKVAAESFEKTETSSASEVHAPGDLGGFVEGEDSDRHRIRRHPGRPESSPREVTTTIRPPPAG
jgi:hypothetical protein